MRDPPRHHPCPMDINFCRSLRFKEAGSLISARFDWLALRHHRRPRVFQHPLSTLTLRAARPRPRDDPRRAWFRPRAPRDHRHSHFPFSAGRQVGPDDSEFIAIKLDRPLGTIEGGIRAKEDARLIRWDQTAPASRWRRRVARCRPGLIFDSKRTARRSFRVMTTRP
jgi:hypothetical protein